MSDTQNNPNLTPPADGCQSVVVQEGRVVDANAAFVRLCGVSDVGELLGKPLAEIIRVPEGSDESSRVLQRPDGQKLEIKAYSFSTVFDGRPAVEVIAVEKSHLERLEPPMRQFVERMWSCFEERSVKLDATMRRLDKERVGHHAARGALSDSEERYRQLIDLSPNGIMILNKGIVLTANITLGKLIGLENSETLIGKSAVELFTPESQELVQEAIAAASSRKKLPRDVQLVRHDGTRIDVEVYASAYTGDPKITSYLIVRDVTEHRKAQSELELARMRSEFALEATGIGVWDWYPETNESYYSKAWKAMIGYEDDEIAPNHDEWSSRVHPDDWPAIYEAERRLFSGEAQIYENIHRLKAKDGTYKWILSRGKPVSYGEDGKPARYIGTHTDLTERVNAEAQIEELNRSLSSRNEELESANRELETFSYTVSHDLRSPLRTIDGYSHAIEYDYGHELSDGAKEYLHSIRRATQRLGHLIDDILSLSRINQSPLKLQTVNLGTLAKDIAKDLESAGKSRKFKFEIEPGMTVTGDRRLLHIMLQNLMENAAKFSAGEEVSHIHVGRKDGAFFVRDNGVGFNIQHVAKLFEPFQRLHSEQEFEGSGIGLATVARIVRRHNGRVWAESEIGKGSAFYFTLRERGG